MASDASRNVHSDAVSAIGNTPLIRINSFAPGIGDSEIWIKYERSNPGGSVKDRIGLQMVLDAEEQGLLQPGGTIVEATSGNTGTGLAMVAAQRGYKCIFTIPDKMAQEKIDLLRALGAEVIVCPTAVEKEDPRSYYCVAERISKERENSWYPDQYSHLANPRAHHQTTGPEIWNQIGVRMTHFVATMGTGGTISGCGQALRELATAEGRQPPAIVGVDAVGSILKQWFDSGTVGTAETYKVEGFGEDFIPAATDFSVIDEIRQVNDETCFRGARRLARREGLFVGGSAGGALAIAEDIATEWDARGARAVLVALMPDAGYPYISKFYNDDWLRQEGYDPDAWLAEEEQG
jgi:cystathionine beta-synthase